MTFNALAVGITENYQMKRFNTRWILSKAVGEVAEVHCTAQNVPKLGKREMGTEKWQMRETRLS